MDKRSWPWKKKPSDSSANQADKGKHDINNEKPKYVKISIESYMHLTELEEQVESYEEQVQTLEVEVNQLNEKLSEARSEMTDKDNLVKQHAKVAEEAVSGWEKAEAEAAMLKNQVESITMLKLTAEDKASHLDGALKECMRQIRNLKEEHDQKLHELILNKTNLFDKMKLELVFQISNLEQDLRKSTSDNSALSRSLQDRSNMLIKLSREKSEAEAEIEFLKTNIGSLEKEVNSLKYEVHVARKEVEIRNEEKNMSFRSFEVANKQNLEGVKKIAKLEAECQRLRGLVRKKLPGPGALAQMKLEVEHLGRDNGENRLRMSLDSSLKYQKENDLLMERLLAMDEDRKILKEALENCNRDLESSRSIYQRTISKLQCLEAQVQASVERKNHPMYSKDDNVSCVGSCVTVSVAENNYIQKENANQLDLMDDFLEMEKLAHVSHAGSEIKSCIDNVQTNDQALRIAISRIYDFLMNLGNEFKTVPGTTSDADGFIEKLNMFCTKYGEAIKSKIDLVDFVLDVSYVLTKATSLKFSAVGFESPQLENSNSSDFIDKVALPENNCLKLSDSSSESDIPSFGNLVPTSESKADLLRKCFLEEFEQLKMDKDNLALDFGRCMENFESTKSRLLETEELLGDVKSQLISAQKSNSLAETQLKCMAELYRALETRAEGLQTEVNFLHGKIESLDNELREERKNYQDALTRCNHLVEQLKRIDNCAAPVDDDASQHQENELTAAAGKLAECQETIHLLDKQLKALRPQATLRNPKLGVSELEEINGINYFEQPKTDISDTFNTHRTNSETTLDYLLNGPLSPSEYEPNRPIISRVRSEVPKHRPTKSGSSSGSSPTSTPEKQSRGFSRFFSSKGKNTHVLA